MRAFQSTPPVKAATVHSADKAIYVRISIHAAREGGDSISLSPRELEGISIHAAREGGDRKDAVHVAAAFHFNPRRP